MATDDLAKAREESAQLRRSYLEYPGEAPDVDYKAACAFKLGDDFSLDLTRHILGMANAGGGYIVIGYKEDANKRPQPDAGLNEAIVASYDQSNLADFVEKHIRGEDKVDLTVYKEPHLGQIFPMVHVRPFVRRPFFCRSTKTNQKGDSVLKEGALYFRNASARTVELAGPAEWEKLIDLCVERRQGELVQRLSTVLEQAGFPIGARLPERPKRTTKKRKPKTKRSQEKVRRSAEIQEFSQQARGEAERSLHDHDFTWGYFEVTHGPLQDHKWGQTELLNAAEKSMVRRTGWPMGVVLHTEKRPKPTSGGIVADIFSDFISTHVDYWKLSTRGDFYLARSFQEDTRRDTKSEPGKVLFFNTQLWRIAEAFEHAALLYRNLDLKPDEPFWIRIRYKGLKGRVLASSTPLRDLSYERTTAEDEVAWEGEVTQDLVVARLKGYVKAVSDSLFTMFDFFKLGSEVVSEIVDEYLASRT